MCEQQYGFAPSKGATEEVFALGMLMEKDFHGVFIDLEKTYKRVQTEELLQCMKDVWSD